MKILFTGASSFSGMWFVKGLAEAGHHVTAIFQKPLEAYTGLRRKRIELLLPCCHPVFASSFGEESFLEVIAQRHWDLLCHHAADVTDYKSPQFDPSLALAKNTKNLKEIILGLQKSNCNKILLTGSVFEQNEGAGSDGLRAVSPYGLSKGLTTDMFAFYTSIMKMKLGKFVIPNPFGPYEEGRFCTYLIQHWISDKTAVVNTPLYVRDNIPIGLLAKAYVKFAEKLSDEAGFEKLNPSCYVEAQGAFTQRFAHEMRFRLKKPCNFELKIQKDFSEPLTRINTDRLDWPLLQWDESQFWDQLAEFYQATYKDNT